MRFEDEDVLVVYDPRQAENLARALVEFAEAGLTMVAGDPGRFVNEGERASAVVVSGGMLSAEGSWTAEHVRKLANAAGQHGQVQWARCPECGHEHYDGFGGVPCGEPDCDCERSYLPRAT